MAPEKAPAFQFYPKDFLSDSNVLRMSMEARGVYITLLSLAWLDGAVPMYPRELAPLVNLPDKQFARVWPAVRVCFQEHDGQLIVPRLEVERAKQADYRRRQSDKGRASAVARTVVQLDGNRGSTVVQPEANQTPDEPRISVEPEGNSSSSSSSSSAKQPSAVAAAAMPRYVGKQQPIPGYRRLRIFPFMVDETLAMLGEYAEDFDLDKWLLQLDSSGRVLPPNLWPWMKEAVSLEAASRGFGAASVSNGSHTNIDAVREILRRDGVIE